MSIRDEFEEWAEGELGLSPFRLASGEYQSFGMSCAWFAWTASRSSALEIPDTSAYERKLKRDKPALIRQQVLDSVASDPIPHVGLTVKP